MKKNLDQWKDTDDRRETYKSEGLYTKYNVPLHPEGLYKRSLSRKRSKIATKFYPLAIVVTDKVTSKTTLLLTELVV